MDYSTFGRHVAIDTWGVDFEKLNDARFLEEQMIEAAKAAGATVLSSQKQQFDPQGATVLVLLSESHISIHTYPEKGFAALDCYTCGETVDPEVAINHMIKVLVPKKTSVKLLKRGDGPIEVLR
ncbi:adenosylmethionine decarboxylase [Heliobacterium gestii]|uniref:S-adenosylmethionine decarboxylase proenzyme n=1 Tax=Heliomicrobium gestii TaxID=2699 RepID=A0A845LEK7_HELGE|nr:adenosylmethionine decarboxylase [Heliomicrobium gestii]MBM7867838.1 S-adenosylmethionine decarboxylase [Heliomicrobium gestii]MZP43350.1 adenosylmethionine decarboxylase [Heliomicrobium gestii]